MGAIVTYENTLEVFPHQFTADASDIGLPPGQWPRMLDTSMGNKMPFILAGFTPEVTLYRQGNGCLTLRVYND